MRAYTGLLMILLALAAACGPRQTTAPANDSTAPVKPANGGTIVYRLASPPATFNYLVANDEPSVVLSFYLLGSRLVDFDHRSRTFVPALAESWTLGPDGRTVDINLRDGLKFSDGSALTTKDVDFTLRAIYDERSEAVAYRDSLMIDEKPIESRIIDPLRMQLVFPMRVPSVETYLTNFDVLPSHILEPELAAGKLAKAWSIDSDTQKIVTSGPFTVESATAGESVTLRRNPNYWKSTADGSRLPFIDKLVLKVLPDPNSAFAALASGDLDIVDRIRVTDFTSLNSSEGAGNAVDLGPGMATDYIWFNLNPSTKGGRRLETEPKYKWFSDKRFRRAISYAVDRQTISTATLRGLATPLYGFISPADRDWIKESSFKPTYDLDAARKLLSEAGFVVRDNRSTPELFDQAGNRVEFSLLVPAGSEPRILMAAAVQEDLSKLGILMHIVTIEPPALAEKWTTTFDYDAVLFGLAVTDFEPSSFANFLLSSGATHQWHPEQKKPATEWEARVDDLFTRQASETDREKRSALFGEIQDIIVDESPIIPIVARHVTSAANKRIGNYAPSIVMPNSLWNIDELFVKN